jgi:XisI protein
MDKILKYKNAILQYLEQYIKGYQNAPDSLDNQLIADDRGHHYQLLRVGWSNKKFIHFCVFHFDIKDGKIWVQVNETEELIADELVRLGVPADDIVLGFQPEYLREAQA